MVARHPVRSVSLLLAAAVSGALLLSACGGGGGDSSSGSSAGAAQDGAALSEPGTKAVAPDRSGADASTEDRSSAGSGDQQAAVLVDPQKIVRTADMSVQARDVERAVASVRQAVEAADGYVSDERTIVWRDGPVEPVGPGDLGAGGGSATSSGGSVGPQTSSGSPDEGAGSAPSPAPRPSTQSVLTARVPNAALDRVMQQVGATGTVLSRNQSSTDVTAQYVDTSSRVATQRASVERVRALLAKATSLGQVVQIEGELSRREADLESLEAQLKALQDKTSLSTLTVTLTPVGAPPAPASDQHGFVAGLHAGWDAFTATMTAVLTALGALLPFLLLIAAVGAPVLLWLRRRRPTTPAQPAQPAAPAP